MDRIKSVIDGKDNAVLSQMLAFYKRPAGRIVDLTANKRRIWKGIDTSNVTFCDIDPEMNPDVVCDYKATPFDDASFSLVVWDPPHLPSAAGSMKSMAQFKNNFGLEHSVQGDNISTTFRPFLAEARRILTPDGLIFAKLIDFVHNHRYQWSLADFIHAANDTPGITPCDLIIKRDPSAGHMTSGRWKATHHARRSHAYWIILRKGKCEPRHSNHG